MSAGIFTMKRRAFLSGLSSAALIAPRTGLSQTSNKLDDVSLRLNWFFSGQYLPIYLGVDKGYFAEQGINLAVAEGKGTITTASAIANGSENFGYLDIGATARLIDKGLPIKCIALIRQKSAASVVTLAKNGIKKAEDLVGKTIASTPGDSSTIFPALLKAAKIDPTTVHLAGLDQSIFIKSLISGQVDGLIGYQDVEGFIVENQGIPTNSILFRDYGVNVVQHGFVASNSTIASKPDLVRRFVSAVVKSYTYALANSDEAATIGKKYFPVYDPALSKKQMVFLSTVIGDHVKEGKPIGWTAPADWIPSLKILHEYVGLQNTDPATYHSNAFFPTS